MDKLVGDSAPTHKIQAYDVFIMCVNLVCSVSPSSHELLVTQIPVESSIGVGLGRELCKMQGSNLSESGYSTVSTEL